MLDSVIGTFLTQNVSDTLSSTAYMQLVAAFPLLQPPRGHLLRQDGASSTEDSASHTADWDAVRRGENSVAVEDAIQCRGMHKMLTRHIQSCLNSLREELYETRVADLISHHRLTPLMRGLSLQDSPQDLEDGGSCCSSFIRHSSAACNAPEPPVLPPSCRCRRPGCSGELCLEWLRALPANESNEYLQKIVGLGGKSASCISLLCLGHKV